MSRYVKKAVYDLEMGEIFRIYVFPNDDDADVHFLRTKKRGWAMSDVMEDEYHALQETTPAGRLAHVIDVQRIRRKLDEREKEIYDVHEFGIAYQDLRPVKAVFRRSERAVEMAGDINNLIPYSLLRGIDFSRDLSTKLKSEEKRTVVVPIEIDGIGGKEIIGYELKPETIITEKAEKIKAK